MRSMHLRPGTTGGHPLHEVRADRRNRRTRIVSDRGNARCASSLITRPCVIDFRLLAFARNFVPSTGSRPVQLHSPCQTNHLDGHRPAILQVPLAELTQRPMLWKVARRQHAQRYVLLQQNPVTPSLQTCYFLAGGQPGTGVADHDPE